jgi:hypothetical protein
MNYEQAQAEINKTEQLYGSKTHLEPPHSIVMCIIAPTDCDPVTRQKLHSECMFNRKSNRQALEELNLLGQDMTPYVIMKLRGEDYMITLTSYLGFLDNLISQSDKL